MGFIILFLLPENSNDDFLWRQYLTLNQKLHNFAHYLKDDLKYFLLF